MRLLAGTVIDTTLSRPCRAEAESSDVRAPFGGVSVLAEINSIDREDRLVTIDGKRYQIDESIQVSDLDEGDKVTITVESDDPYDLITDID